MSQVSPPIRILLIGSIVFLAAWFTLLRPKAEETVAPAPAAPVAAQPVTSAGQAVQAATQGAETAQAAAEAAAGETVAPATTAGSAPQSGATPVKPADTVDTAGLPKVVARAVADKKVLVMLFWNPKAADDRAVRRELKAIDRHKGNVKVHVASLKDVSRYSPITRGVNLEQSPTVVVVDRHRTADALVGYHDRFAIDQAVSDALRAKK